MTLRKTCALHVRSPAAWASMAVQPVRRAVWQRSMAGCCLALGDLDNARRHALHALRHLSAPLPSDPAAAVTTLRAWLAQARARSSAPLLNPKPLAKRGIRPPPAFGGLWLPD